MTLKDLRLNKGFSLRTLGEKLGISRTSVMNYEESNKLPFKQVEKYAKIFDLTTEELLNICSKDTESIIYDPNEFNGRRFSKLVVVERINFEKVRVKCDCGNEKIVRIKNLFNKHTKSCGCIKHELMQKNNTSGTIGVTYHSLSKKWLAQISINKQHINLGTYVTKDEAIAARKAAEKVYFYLKEKFPRNT